MPEPNAMAEPATSVPLFNTSPPVVVLTPLSVNLPAPFFVNTPMPERVPEITESFPLVSNVPLPARVTAVLTVMPPAPAWRVPPLRAMVLVPELRLAVLPLSVPLVSVNPPVRVLVPVSVKRPLPDTVNTPLPEITPESVELVVGAPVSNIPAPFIAMALAVEIPPIPDCNVPPLKTIPLATLLPLRLAVVALRMPPLKVSKPVWVLVPVRIRVPPPALIKDRIPPLVPSARTPA